LPLTPGTLLGPYEIVSLLGHGGMGEVYRAHDARLKRDVAIKTSAQRFNEGFEREARAIAALNHPNICQIYDVGPDYIVMELVEGASPKGPLPLDEALRIAGQIAAALEAAHEKGIVHRDLKPANIKIRDDGTVKVLDFGLAKALEPPGGSSASGGMSMSPTITTPAMMTGVGVVLGTAAYMSPEQAKGRAADKRSDVWAFGCVLYEMLTGRRAFAEDDVADTLAAVLRAEPDWSRLPPETPAPLRILIARCLVKDRRQRIADLAVAQFVLAETAGLVSHGASAAAAMPVAAGTRWKSWLAVAVAVLMAAALAGTAAWRLRPSALAAPVARFSFSLPKLQQTSIISRHGLAISPDGTVLVYVADNRLFVRKLAEFEAYGAMWLELVPRFGGIHHGYFLPSEGESDIALAMFSFPSLAAYEQYRKDAAAESATRNVFGYGYTMGRHCRSD
jgi:predicted Ser/Thr protein kinase